MSETEKIFKADKVSGMEAKLITISTLTEVVKNCGERTPFAFPFHGVTFDVQADKADEWALEDEYAEVSNKVLEYCKSNGLGVFEQLADSSENEANELQGIGRELTKEIDRFSNADLVLKYDEFVKKYFWFYGQGAVTFLFESALSEQLTDLFKKRGANSSELMHRAMKSEYTSFMIVSEEWLAEIERTTDAGLKNQLIENYIKDFYFIDTNYRRSKILDRNQVLSMASGKTKARDKDQEDTKNFDLTRDEQVIINLLKLAEKIRDQRKKINLIGNFVMFRFAEEAAKRLNQNPDLIANITWFEFAKLFKSDNEHFFEILRKRKLYTVVFDHGDNYFLDGTCIMDRKEVNLKIKEIKGTPAARGNVIGEIIIILGTNDFGKMKDGAIMVSEMTRPDYVSAVKRAAAVITDEGGITCHAAIVSRELNIPCIVGTKIATKVLKDGDSVEVDANTGVIRIL